MISTGPEPIVFTENSRPKHPGPIDGANRLNASFVFVYRRLPDSLSGLYL